MTLRGFLTFGIRRGWHKLVTLACLLVFVFVAASHAGHHLAIANDAAVVTGIYTPADGSDGGDAVKEGVCVFCALAAAELPSVPVIEANKLRVLVETREAPLAPPSCVAELPPPIT